MFENRCVMSHEPIVQKKVLVTEIDVIKKEDRNGNIADVNNHIELHDLGKKKESLEGMLS